MPSATKKKKTLLTFYAKEIFLCCITINKVTDAMNEQLLAEVYILRKLLAAFVLHDW